VVHRPPDIGLFKFAVLSSLRAAQLTRGCTPRVDGGDHKRTVIAQLEVAAGHVQQAPPTAAGTANGVAPAAVLIEDALAAT
jgi:hypothetical protein